MYRNVVHPSRARKEPTAVDQGTAEPEDDTAVETPPEIVKTSVNVVVHRKLTQE